MPFSLTIFKGEIMEESHAIKPVIVSSIPNIEQARTIAHKCPL